MEKTSVADEVATIKIKNIIKAMPPMEQAGAVEGIRDDCLWQEIKRRFSVLWNDFDGEVMDLGVPPGMTGKKNWQLLMKWKNAITRRRKSW